MVRAKRVARPKDDLKREFRDQLQLLKMACESFDRGIEAAGKYIAVSLRVLLHHQGHSRALLEQLGYRTGRFYSSIEPPHPGNLVLSEFPMAAMTSTGRGVKWSPLVHLNGGPPTMRALQFSDWWAERIIRDSDGNTFSRMTLIQSVANTDGGAHVDPDLEEAYMALSRENSLGWVVNSSMKSLDDGGRSGQPLDGRIELVCMRQIAHELLFTIHKNVPEFSDAAQPVMLPPR